MNSKAVYIFGYSSLLLKVSVAGTIGGNESGLDAIPAKLKGFKRVWNSIRYAKDMNTKRYVYTSDWSVVEKFTWSNLAHHETSFVNGVCYRVNQTELQEIDYRETGYERVEITYAIDPYWNFQLEPNLPCFTYIDTATQDIQLEEPGVFISKDYVNMGIEGARKIGRSVDNFFGDFIATTSIPSCQIEDIKQIFFSDDGIHMWLLNEPDSSLILIHKFNIPQFSPLSKSCAELGSNITSSLGYLDLRNQPSSYHESHVWIEFAAARHMTDPQFITSLSKHQCWLVRLAIADNPSTPRNVLLQLATDADPWVVRCANIRNK